MTIFVDLKDMIVLGFLIAGLLVGGLMYLAAIAISAWKRRKDTDQ